MSFPPIMVIPKPMLALLIWILVGFPIMIGFFTETSSSSFTGSRTRIGDRRVKRGVMTGADTEMVIKHIPYYPALRCMHLYTKQHIFGVISWFRIQ